MKGRPLIVVGVMLIGAVPAMAQTPTERAKSVSWILERMEPDTVGFLRTNCAVGDAIFGSNMIVDATKAAIKLNTAELCVTVLTRSGRDGTLQYMALKNGGTPSSLSFDSGFVGGYRARALPRGAPTMATLLPIAQRCLEQREADKDLCNAAGQILGVRAALGEVITTD